jgi:hypothetical protein
MSALFMRKNRELGVLSGMLARTVLAVGLVATLVACDSGNDPTVPSYTIGGTVSGLTGSGLVLQNNAGDNLSISANGAFTFATPVANGGDYAVTVMTSPTSPSQTCTVSNGSGMVAGSDVANVTVVCATNNFTIGGTVSGLTGSGLVFQNNAVDNLSIPANGAFTFATPVASGDNYAVTVRTQPASPSQTCTVTNGTGTVSDGDVAVTIQCAEAYILPTSATDISLGADSVLVDGNKVYVVAGTAFKVLDVSNPLSPSLLGTVTHGYTDLRVEAHAIHDNIVWCVRSSSGGYGGATYVFGVDVSDPANPVIRGSLTLQSSSSLLWYDSLIYSGYLLVHDYSRNMIYVLDISNPDAPVKFSEWAVPNMVNGGSGDMLIEGTLLYLPCGENGTFRIYNLANLAAVTQVGSVSTGAENYGTAVKIGSYVYMTTNSPNMKVIDVSDPASPAVVGSVAFTGYLKGRNGKLFSFGHSTPTVYAYSLANPIAPVVEESSTVPAPAPSTSLSVSPMNNATATWVGNYLIGMTYGSAPQYNGARALNFTVN